MAINLNEEEKELAPMLDIYNLTLAEPPKVNIQPVSAIFLGWWARFYGVGQPGKMGMGTFVNNLAVSRAIANKSERDEVLEIEMLRRQHLGLPSDKYSTLYAIAIESQLFRERAEDEAANTAKALQLAEQLVEAVKERNPELQVLVAKVERAIAKTKPKD